jgi:hypothetical protein
MKPQAQGIKVTMGNKRGVVRIRKNNDHEPRCLFQATKLPSRTEVTRANISGVVQVRENNDHETHFFSRQQNYPWPAAHGRVK